MERLTIKMILICSVSVFLVNAVFSSLPAQAGKYPYPEFIDYIAPEVRKILIRNGLTIKPNQENQWFKWSGTPGNYIIVYYLSEEIPQEAILETISFLMDIYEQRNRKENFKLLLYRESHEEKIKLFSGAKPYCEFSIKGE